MNIGVVCTVAAALIFSCGGLFVKLAAMPAVLLVGWRTLVPFVVVALARPALVRSFIAKPKPALLVISALSALRISCWVIGIQLAPLSKAAVILYTWPLIFTLLSAWFADEPLTRRSVKLLILGFGGVLVMTLDTSSLTDAQQMRGLLLMLCAAVINAIYFFLVKKQLNIREPDEVLLSENVVAACLYLPFVLSNLASVPATSIVWLAGYGGVLGVVGYCLLYMGLRRVSSATASILLYTEVVGACILGVLVFGESVTLRMLVSAAMILTAAYLVRNQPNPGLSHREVS